MEIEHPKKDRAGRKGGKGRGGDVSSSRSNRQNDAGYNRGRQIDASPQLRTLVVIIVLDRVKLSYFLPVRGSVVRVVHIVNPFLW